MQVWPRNHDRRGASLRPNLRGFTLVELVMVVCILGIVAGIAVPRFAGSLRRYRVEAAASRVANDLNLARRYARLSSNSQTLSFNVLADSYRLVGRADLDHPAAEYEVRLDRQPYEVRILSADFDGDADVIFDGYGMPDSGGTVVVGIGPEQRTILLDQSLSLASVQ